MKIYYSQLELIELLENNPLGIDVCFGEVNDLGDEDYIFIDRIMDTSILADNKACYVNAVQVSIYCKNIENLNQTSRFIRDKFICTPVYSRDEEHEYYTCIFDINVKVSDW